MSETKKRQRSEYLKSGCKECKRRKIKCDEFFNAPPFAVRTINDQGRALCWQCTRLKKECVYPMKGEKVARVSRKVLLEKERQAAAAAAAAAATSPESARSGSNSVSPIHGDRLAKHAMHYGTTTHSLPQSYHGSTASANSNSQNAAAAAAATHIHYSAAQSMAQGAHGLVGAGPAVTALNPVYPQEPRTGMLGRPYRGDHDKMLPVALPLALAYMPLPLLGPGMPGAPGMHRGEVGLQSGPIGPMMLGPESAQSYDPSDLALLASDLNNLVSDMMDDVDHKALMELESQQTTPPTPTSDGGPLLDASKAHVNSNDWIPRNVGLGYIDVRNSEERLYLQEFYLEFANVILPFNAYDRALQSHFNPVRDILLKCASKEPFLLAAILSQGARSAFSKSEIPEVEEAYYQYLLRCLKLLGPALGDASGKNGLALVSNIEAVLLTVLLLTSSNAANAKQNWRPHLKGAKDLLLKHTTSKPYVRNSKVLIFCKFWFMSFEVLAGLGLKLGGTIKLDEELDLLFQLDPYEIQVLTELGLLQQSGFNLIGGYHNDCLFLLRDLIKLLNRRRNNSKYVPNETGEYIRLLATFDRQRNYEFFKRKAILSNEDLPGGVAPAGLLLDPIVMNHKMIIISWMDLSQQLYALASMITILTDFFNLAYDSPQVQDLESRLLALVSFLAESQETPRVMKCSILMIQWPMLVAGFNAVTEADKQIVIKFFASATSFGAGSAGHSINRVQRMWRLREGGVLDSGDDNVDVVNY